MERLAVENLTGACDGVSTVVADGHLDAIVRSRRFDVWPTERLTSDGGPDCEKGAGEECSSLGRETQGHLTLSTWRDRRCCDARIDRAERCSARQPFYSNGCVTGSAVPLGRGFNRVDKVVHA
jgi:hypothetical protein